MEYDKRELNKYGRKHKERGRHDIDFDKGAVNAPIAVRAIMKLIEYYTSIAKHDSVKALTIKLNRFLKSIGASHRHGGLSGENTPVDPGDPSGEGDFLVGEDFDFILTENSFFIEPTTGNDPPPVNDITIAEIISFENFFIGDDVSWTVTNNSTPGYTYSAKLKIGSSVIKTVSGVLGNNYTFPITAQDAALMTGLLSVGQSSLVATLEVATYSNGSFVGTTIDTATATVRPPMEDGDYIASENLYLLLSESGYFLAPESDTDLPPIDDITVADIISFENFFIGDDVPWVIANNSAPGYTYSAKLKIGSNVIKTVSGVLGNAHIFSITTQDAALMTSLLATGQTSLTATLEVTTYSNGSFVGMKTATATATVMPSMEDGDYIASESLYMLLTESGHFLAPESDSESPALKASIGTFSDFIIGNDVPWGIVPANQKNYLYSVTLVVGGLLIGNVSGISNLSGVFPIDEAKKSMMLAKLVYPGRVLPAIMTLETFYNGASLGSVSSTKTASASGGYIPDEPELATVSVFDDFNIGDDIPWELSHPDIDKYPYKFTLSLYAMGTRIKKISNIDYLSGTMTIDSNEKSIMESLVIPGETIVYAILKVTTMVGLEEIGDTFKTVIGSSSGSVDPDDPENDTSGDYFAITDDDEYLITSTEHFLIL